MKRILNPIFLLLISASFILISCDDEGNPVDNDYTVSGNASGSQEVPAVSTSASGTLTGTYNASNNTLQYAISWSGLSGNVAAMHFHGPAVVGANAGVIHDLFATIIVNGLTGNASGSIILADSTELHLLNGKLYYNIHTATNPTGEIRGQVFATQ